MQILIAANDKKSGTELSDIMQEWGYEVIEASNGQEVLSVLTGEAAPKMILLEWEIPEMCGLELVKKISKISTEIPFYIIMLTAKGEKSDIIEGLNEGASDYLVIPFDMGELRARINVGRRTIELHDELIHSRKKLEYQVAHDALTGLYSRSFILEYLNKELARAERIAEGITVAICDIDYFKKVNDEYGHPIGDIVLKEFAHILTENIREYDIIGRLGGEEFLLITTTKQEDEENSIFERIREKVENSVIKTEAGEISITISIGAASYINGKSGENLIYEADKALYTAKEEGRNRVKWRK